MFGLMAVACRAISPDESASLAGDAPLLTYLNGPLLVLADRCSMDPPKEPRPNRDGPPSEPSRLEEARQVIAEYAADLREIIKKLRRRLT